MTQHACMHTNMKHKAIKLLEDNIRENLPTLQHSGKGKTMETVKRLGVVRNQGKKCSDEQVDHRNFQGKAVKIFCMRLQWPIPVIIHLFKPIEQTTQIGNYVKFN